MSKDDDITRKIKEAKVKKVIDKIQKEIEETKSLEFKRFMEEEAERWGKLNWYERLCKKAGKFIRIDLGKKLHEDMQRDILISGLKIKPEDVSSLAFTTMLFFMVIFTPFMILLASMEKFLIPFLGLGITYYFLTYPKYAATITRIKASDEAMKVLLYILVYLRLNPDMLGAVKFAAAKCHGPVGLDLKKVMWDVETGKFTNIDDAMRVYGEKWRLFDEAFVKALEMLKNVRFLVSEERRAALLHKTLNYVLDNTYENMRNYSVGLKNPISMVHAMGITLPIFGLILFPMVSIFMHGEIRIDYIMIGYIIILPLFIGWYVNRIISKRPGAFTHPDVEDEEPEDKFILRMGSKKYYIPLIPLCIFVFVIISLPGLIHFIGVAQNYLYISGFESEIAGKMWVKFLQGQYTAENLIPNTILTLTIIFGIMASLVIYFRSKSARKEKIRKDVEKIEGQFQLTLYSLGNVLESNVPIEKSLIYLINEYEKSEKKQTEMLDFLKGVRTNMLVNNMLIESAFFDNKKGVVWRYPSVLIRDICRIVVDSVKKGSIVLSMICKTISKFLGRLSKVELLIRELLEETLSGIRLQAGFIAPFICGIVAAASSILVQLLQNISLMLEELERTIGLQATSIYSGTESLSESLKLIDLEKVMPPTLMQLFVGIYLIEIVILLCMLLNGIEHGFDRINRDMLIARSLVQSVILFSIVVMIITVLFMPIVSQVGAIG